VLEKMEQETAVAADEAGAAALAEAEKAPPPSTRRSKRTRTPCAEEEADLLPAARQRSPRCRRPARALRADPDRAQGQGDRRAGGDSCAGCGGRIPAQAAIQVRRRLASSSARIAAAC
jgi:hypothetical protein